MVPSDGQRFFLYLEIPEPAKVIDCLCDRWAEGGGVRGLLPTLKILHHELLPGLTLLASFQASKLQCWWIMTAGELCCVCKCPSYIKGTSEQVNAVHMKALLPSLGEAGGGPSWLGVVAVRLQISSFPDGHLLLEESNCKLKVSAGPESILCCVGDMRHETGR